MPPKKKAAATDTSTEVSTVEGGETKFGWTAENDRALLILCFGRNPTTEDYTRFVSALPAGASYNGVKIRCSKMRMEMKKRYEELGWEVPETTNPKANAIKTGAGKKDTVKDGAAGKKRKAGEVVDDAAEDEGEEEEKQTKVKKARAKRGEGKGKKFKKGEVEADEEDGGAGAGGEEGAVKEEEVEASV